MSNINFCPILISEHCPDPKCSGHGTCQEGHCLCDLGWMGRSCEARNAALSQCLPDCSGHGRFDQALGRCDCHNKWAGRDCNISKSPNCGEWTSLAIR